MRFVIDSRYVRRRPSGIGTCVEALVERLPRLAPQSQFHAWTHPERPIPPAAPNLSHTVVTATADGVGTLLWPAQLDRLEEDDVVHFPFGLLGRGIPCATVVTINDLMWYEQPELVERAAIMASVATELLPTGNALGHAASHAHHHDFTGHRRSGRGASACGARSSARHTARREKRLSSNHWPRSSTRSGCDAHRFACTLFPHRWQERAV